MPRFFETERDRNWLSVTFAFEGQRSFFEPSIDYGLTGHTKAPAMTEDRFVQSSPLRV